jgi:hypothetical protein
LCESAAEALPGLSRGFETEGGTIKSYHKTTNRYLTNADDGLAQAFLARPTGPFVRFAACEFRVLGVLSGRLTHTDAVLIIAGSM